MSNEMQKQSSAMSPEAMQFQQMPSQYKPSNPAKGRKNRHAARAFLDKYPIGSTLTWEDYCDWAQENGLYDKDAQIPPLREQSTQDGKPLFDENGEPIMQDVDRKSQKWLAHLQRRHQALNDHKKASEHEDLRVDGVGSAYTIMPQKGKTLKVVSVRDAWLESKAAQQIDSFVRSKKRRLVHLFQSTEWAQLEPYDKLFAEALMDDIDDWADQIKGRKDQLENKFKKLKLRLDAAVKSGRIQPSNGGIAGMLEDDSND